MGTNKAKDMMDAAAEKAPEDMDAVMKRIADLEAKLSSTVGMAEALVATVEEQKLQLQQVGNAMVPVAPSQPMKLREPVSFTTARGNVVTSR